MIKPKTTKRVHRGGISSGSGGYRRSRSPGRAGQAIIPAPQETYSPDGSYVRGFRNGLPAQPYLPADPGRRERYLEALRKARELESQRLARRT